MKLIVTILEETFDAALAAIRRLDSHHDGIELRAEGLESVDLAALRASTEKLLILTHRGRRVTEATIAAAVAAGIDLVDVEWHDDLAGIDRPDRVILSHHDYEGMPDVEVLGRAMRARGCAATKLAVTPSTLAENLRLLRLSGNGMTVIGMGERGLYSRVLAPFRGSAFAFVASGRIAAPAQLSLEHARAIFGDDRASLAASAVFAIAGDPAGHSLSPAIHNRRFRERGVDAAYTIASFDAFDPIGQAILEGELRGISVTAPFKESAFAFAAKHGATFGDAAREAGVINTLVMRKGTLYADNTDVDGFELLISKAILRVPIGSAAVIGAGGTARAAAVVLARHGIPFRVFNRSRRPFFETVEPLEVVAAAGGDLVINTLPAGVDVQLPLRALAAIDAIYPSRPMPDALCSFNGNDLLQAQAVRQNQIFIEALH